MRRFASADTLENYVGEDGWPTYSALSAELDRFENLLEQLLRLAHAEQVSGSRKVGLTTTAAESADLADVLAERVAYWQPILDSEDQHLDNRPNHLVAPKPDDVAAAQAAAVLPHAEALPVRVGFGVIGTIIVFGLIMAARSLNRRPQH